MTVLAALTIVSPSVASSSMKGDADAQRVESDYLFEHLAAEDDSVAERSRGEDFVHDDDAPRRRC